MFIILFASPLFVITTILIAVVLAEEIKNIFAYITGLQLIKIHIDPLHQKCKSSNIKIFFNKCIGGKSF